MVPTLDVIPQFYSQWSHHGELWERYGPYYCGLGWSKAYVKSTCLAIRRNVIFMRKSTINSVGTGKCRVPRSHCLLLVRRPQPKKRLATKTSPVQKPSKNQSLIHHGITAITLVSFADLNKNGKYAVFILSCCRQRAGPYWLFQWPAHWLHNYLLL